MEHTSSGSSFGKFIGVLIVIGLMVLVIFLDARRRDAERKLNELSVQYGGAGQAQNREAAQAVIDKVRKLYTIPADVEPTVATIVDVNQLRARNAFYAKAKNGDHLIVTNDRAILYDPIANKIIDVVPVQIQAGASSAASSQ